MSTMNYTRAGRNYAGLLKRPGSGADAAVRAAVVLLPDWRGAGPLAHSHANYLVSLGCTVLVADLYGDGFAPSNPDGAAAMVERLMRDREGSAAALGAGIDQLLTNVPPHTPLVLVGYSAGGMIALDYARIADDERLAGVVLCSGLIKTASTSMTPHIACPVLLVQGTQDAVSPMPVIAELIAEMDQADNDLQTMLLTRTHHGFDNPEAGSDPTARIVYSEDAATRARIAIATFLNSVAPISD